MDRPDQPSDLRERLLAEFIAVHEAGLEPDRDALLARHPDLADSLAAEIDEYLALHAATAVSPARPSTPERVGRYRIHDVLGVGGMGVVYLAEQESPRRRVALKVIRPEYASPTYLRRFAVEAEILGRLEHPGIARIYEAGTDSSCDTPTPFFAMEFVHGRPLCEDATRRRLDVRERVQLLVDVCDAVHHAHEQGIVHRDLKPQNILVDDAGKPRVLDFGVARVLDAGRTTIGTSSGQLVGTLHYMSPEQVSTDPAAVDARSDVYTLGVVAYELIGAQFPYDLSGRSLSDTCRIIQDETPAPLSSIDRALRGDLDVIVAKALEKERTRRYRSAMALADDLRRYLADARWMFGNVPGNPDVWLTHLQYWMASSEGADDPAYRRPCLDNVVRLAFDRRNVGDVWGLAQIACNLDDLSLAAGIRSFAAREDPNRSFLRLQFEARFAAKEQRWRDAFDAANEAIQRFAELPTWNLQQLRDIRDEAAGHR